MMTMSTNSAERKIIVPENGAKPVGPYSPGVLVGDYLYASGQGVRDAEGKVPEGLAAQTRQCLDNVKAIVEAAGLTMEHIVHMQLYLEKMSDLAEVERIYATYFPHNPPARVLIGTAKMPTDTPVELTVVAVRNLKQKKARMLKNLSPVGHASSAIEIGNRIYLSGVGGKDQTEATQKLKQALGELGLTEANVVFRNDYGTNAAAMIPLNELPDQMQYCISAIAVRKGLSRGRAADSFCVADGNTIFCTAQTDATRQNVAQQVQEIMQSLYVGLSQHSAVLSQTVATNVYLDDITEFKAMNDTYGSFFPNSPPTRTTVQPFAKADRNQGNVPLVRISLIAVKE